MGFMMLFRIAVVVGIVFLVVHLARRPVSQGWQQTPTYPASWEARGPERNTGGALQVLEERYARGEIDRDDFLRRRGDLVTRP